jgi:hypothetical protein
MNFAYTDGGLGMTIRRVLTCETACRDYQKVTRQARVGGWHGTNDVEAGL